MRLSYYYLALLGILCSCKPGVKEENGNQKDLKAKLKNHLTGYWVNRNFLDKIEDNLARKVNILEGINFYCEEMWYVPDNDDSMRVRTAQEDYMLELSITDSSAFMLKKASTEGDIQGRLLNNNTFTIRDPFVTSREPDANVITFVKEDESSENSFHSHLNRRTVAGTYIHDYSEKKEGSITFYTDGKLEGLPGYSGYAICYGGDCAGESEENKNIIILKKDSRHFDYYAWEYDPQNFQLIIYSLDAARPDTKGNRKTTGVFCKLLRK